MKKLFSLIAILLALLVVSCSGDGKTPEEGKEEIQGFSDNTFSLDTRNIKSIATTTAELKIDSTADGNRAISNDGNLTMLVYYDRHDRLAPLVFKNSDGQYVMFPVKKSYPLSDDLFAIEFDKMFVSATAPKFMEGTSRDAAKKNPVIENVFELKTYIMRGGQLLVNTSIGKAAFLNQFDFSQFESNAYGTYFYKGEYEKNPYELKDAFVDERNVYMTIGSWRSDVANGGGIYKVSIKDPTILTPMMNGNFLKARNIASGNSKALVIKTIEPSETYLIDMESKLSPRIVTRLDEGTKGAPTINGIRYNTLNNIGCFENEVLLGDQFWHVQTTQGRSMYLFNEDGTPLKDLDLSKGCYVGTKRYEGADIKDSSYDHLYLENGRLSGYLSVDSEGWLVIKSNWKDIPVHSADHNLVFLTPKAAIGRHYIGIGDRACSANNVSDSSFIHDGTEYTYRTREDGFVVASDGKKEYLIDTDHPHDCYLKDSKYLIKDGFITEGNIHDRITSYDEEKGIYTDDKGETFIIEPNENGEYVSRYSFRYLLDENGNKIKALPSRGAWLKDGTKLDLGYDEEGRTTYKGEELHLYREKDGHLYFLDDEPVLVATEIVIGDDLSTSYGKHLWIHIGTKDIGWWDWGYFRLLNILPSERSGAYNLYYAKDMEDGTTRFFIFELDTNGKGSLEKKLEVTLEDADLPDYQYTSIRNWYGNDGSNRKMTWSDDGHMFYWISNENNRLSSLDLDSGQYDYIDVGAIAGNSLNRIGDDLIFSVYVSNVDVETYSLDRHDIHGKRTLISKDLMTMVPLVELDATAL